MLQSRRLSNRLNSPSGKEQRVFKPAQHDDGWGEVSVGRSCRRIAWEKAIEERPRSKLIYPGSIRPPVFCQQLDSGKAENRIVEVERKLLCGVIGFALTSGIESNNTTQSAAPETCFWLSQAAFTETIYETVEEW